MASVPDSSLEAGLTALRDGDYQRAIAHLEAICDQHQTPEQIKAQMGLVVAYEHTGEINRALVLCQSLSNSTSPQTKKWAERKQAELKNRYIATETTTTPPETDVTGFVAFERKQETGDRRQEIRGQGDKETRRQGESGARSQEIRGQGDKEIEEVLISQSPPAPSTSPAPPFSLEWRQAGRAKRWQPNRPVNLIPFWLLEFGTAVLLFWLIRELLKFAMASTNAVLVKLPYLEPIQLFYRDPTLFVLLILGILLVVSPWLLDQLLRLCYGLQPLSRDALSTHSPEAIRVLQRYCRQRRWSLPRLAILPISVPMALTYGNLPRTARIVVTQGLLEQLVDDEIATIYAGQLGHITHWDFVLMSLIILVTGLPYIIYYQVAQWGRTSNPILRSVMAAIASLAYGVWWLLGYSAVWLSQLRIYYSDRLATEITGNPNALSRALLKISQGITLDIQQRGHTSWLLESLNLITLVGYRQAITLGNFHSCSEVERILAWDCLNPARYWLNINNTHPLIGDRLQRLNSIAQQWHLQTELNLVRRQKSGVKSFNSSSSPISFVFTRSSLLQAAPFLGIALGFAFGCLTWLIGGISILFQSAQLAWMYGDWVIIRACLPIGFSIGTFIRINSFFPDITASVQINSLSELLDNPNALPVDSQPVRLQGKLLGRRGISNSLGQDLILQSANGLVKLHHFSWLGAIGNLLLSQSPSPRDLVGENVVVSGWFRRGATSWLDIDSWRLPSGKISRSGHPVWSTLLASAAAVWGAYIILGSGE